jgi:hypothetical protein
MTRTSDGKAFTPKSLAQKSEFGLDAFEHHIWLGKLSCLQFRIDLGSIDAHLESAAA